MVQNKNTTGMNISWIVCVRNKRYHNPCYTNFVLIMNSQFFFARKWSVISGNVLQKQTWLKISNHESR